MSTNLLAQRDTGIVYRQTALEFQRPISYEDWAVAFQMVQQIGESWQWWIGDLLRYGEEAFGEEYAQVFEATQRDEKTIRNAVRVASSIPPEKRRPELTFTHHSEVASLEESVRDQLLDEAVQHKLSTRALRLETGRTVLPEHASPMDSQEEAETMLGCGPKKSDEFVAVALRAICDEFEISVCHTNGIWTVETDFWVAEDSSLAGAFSKACQNLGDV